MAKHLKKILIATGVLLVALMLVAVGYVIYAAASYSRMEDNLKIAVKGNSDKMVEVGKEYRIITYDMNFGAFGKDFSFFAERGKLNDGTKLKGKYGKGISKSEVLHNSNGAVSIVSNLDYDFVFVQSADEDGNRSYHINQAELIKNSLPDYESVYAKNFHSAFLYYPIKDPHGKNDSGILTLSKFHIEGAVRRSLPVAEDVTKYIDTDGCFVVNRLAVEGKELVLVDLRLAAYDKDGEVRKEQFAVLCEFLEAERQKGNYVIAGGNFNCDICDSAGKFEAEQAMPDNLIQIGELPDGYSIAYADDKYKVPSWRSAAMPYVKGESFTAITDGFIASDNIEVTRTVVLDTDFMFSNHNPVIMNFKLKEQK